jgi:CheY-like chemotaxis protein
MRQHASLRRLPVVVLTSSDEPSDITAAYDLGANSYIVKPRGLAELGEVARRLREYWLELNAAPPEL